MTPGYGENVGSPTHCCNRLLDKLYCQWSMQSTVNPIALNGLPHYIFSSLKRDTLKMYGQRVQTDYATKLIESILQFAFW